jgi:hypothetical protein
MDSDPKQLVREHMKVLLLHFAKTTDSPGMELQTLIQELIEELYTETQAIYRERRQLKLVSNAGE